MSRSPRRIALTPGYLLHHYPWRDTSRILEVLTRDAGRALPRVLEAVEAAGGQVRGVELEQPDLEAVFLHLTGRALRDAD